MMMEREVHFVPAVNFFLYIEVDSELCSWNFLRKKSRCFLLDLFLMGFRLPLPRLKKRTFPPFPLGTGWPCKETTYGPL